MKKMKLFATLISAAVMASTTVLGAAAAHYKGDIDRNDSVTISDVVSIQKHLSGKSSIAKDKLIYADMNDDGKINVFDLVLAKRVVLGDAPTEEVPSLTTPVVTTTTPVTSTTISTTVSTTTTPKVTTVMTTTPAETTTTTTTKATTAAETTVTETEVTTEATTTAAETTATETEVTTEATTTVADTTVTETEVTTEATTTVAETTVTETEVTTEATTTVITTTTAGTTYKMTVEPSKSVAVEFDSTKEIDYVEFEAGTENNYNLHVYVDGWSSWFNVDCTNGELTYRNLAANIEAVTIDGNKIKVEFKEGFSGENLIFSSDSGTINVTVTDIVYVGDETPKPAETTATTATTVTESEITTATTVTEATATETESETTATTADSEIVTTGVAGTNVNRGALIIYGNNSLSIDRDYYADLTEATGISVPEIEGNGTYTAKFTLSDSTSITWLELRLLGANGTYLNNTAYPNLAITIDGFKTDGVETTKSLDAVSMSLGNWEGASVNLISLLESTTVNETIEVTFTITGIE